MYQNYVDKYENYITRLTASVGDILLVYALSLLRYINLLTYSYPKYTIYNHL